MHVFFFILINNIVPIFLLIGLGFVLSKQFNFDMNTLSKMIFYLFSPAFIFVNLYETPLSINMLLITLFCTAYMAITYMIAAGVGKWRGYETSLTNAFKNALMFNNTGNIGLSLITLVFSTGPYLIGGETPFLNEAQASLIVVMVFTNITINTFGFYNAGRATMSIKDTMKKIFSMPAVYTIPLAIGLQLSPIDATAWFGWPALVYLKNALVAMALLTLGVQLSKTKIDFHNNSVYLAVFMRLLGGPLLAMVLIAVFGFKGVIAQTLLIAYSVPTAVNTALIAVEFKSQEAYATQVVVTSTIVSAATLTLSIFIAQTLYAVGV
ncbi:MAG: malate permease [Clostridiales bacterium]|jgi:predicted permease|nr:malate permease [Clostridiales bacterium]MDN5299692.1 malate permease [Clostridiales bacterium]